MAPAGGEDGDDGDEAGEQIAPIDDTGVIGWHVAEADRQRHHQCAEQEQPPRPSREPGPTNDDAGRPDGHDRQQGQHPVQGGREQGRRHLPAHGAPEHAERRGHAPVQDRGRLHEEPGLTGDGGGRVDDGVELLLQ